MIRERDDQGVAQELLLLFDTLLVMVVRLHTTREPQRKGSSPLVFIFIILF
jgi:hypothetical protein